MKATVGAMQSDGKKDSSRAGFFGWLAGGMRLHGRARRLPLPGLVAYYFTGGTPMAYRVGDISTSGFFMLTEERPFRGSIIRVTLQRTDENGANMDDSITVNASVVRWDSEGVGLHFVFPQASMRHGYEADRNTPVDQKTLHGFLKRLNPSRSV